LVSQFPNLFSPISPNGVFPKLFSIISQSPTDQNPQFLKFVFSPSHPLLSVTPSSLHCCRWNFECYRCNLICHPI
ncbi:hypothetical protein ES319_A04G080400v1, partial [Gossypium barbadense]